jgi:Tol biopolymer transport system component
MLSVLLAAAALAGAAHSDSRPVWSPDGTRIAFTRVVSGGPYLEVARSNGTGLRRLARILYGTVPSWSPDSRSLVFERQPLQEQERDGSIWTIGANGTHPHRIATGRSPVWSPDGSRIAFGQGRNLETVRPDGSDPFFVITPGTPLEGISWSPDSARLAFATSGGPRLWVATAGVRQQTPQLGNGYLPAWSPDGATIAFSRGACLGLAQWPSTDMRPFCIPVGGVALFQPSWSPDSKSFVACVKHLRLFLEVWPSAKKLGEGCDPSWSQDGSRIAFDRRDSSGGRIYTMNADGSDVRPLFSP